MTYAHKVLVGMQKVSDIFKDRKNYKIGLTKLEVIHAVYNLKYKSILNYRKEKIDSLWNKIGLIRKHLREGGQMAIVGKYYPRGIELLDNLNGFGKRILKKAEVIYWRCFDMDSATATRDEYDKKARGFIQAGNQITKVVSEQIEQQPILQVLNEGRRNED
jgi:hypothetical protein